MLHESNKLAKYFLYMFQTKCEIFSASQQKTASGFAQNSSNREVVAVSKRGIFVEVFNGFKY